MSRATRPSVTLRCVADSHHGPGERIVEFNANDGTGRGGLIALRLQEGGRFVVELYRCDGVTIRTEPATAALCSVCHGARCSACNGTGTATAEYPELEADAAHVGALLAKESS